MNRRSFFRGLIGAAMLGVAAPLGKVSKVEVSKVVPKVYDFTITSVKIGSGSKYALNSAGKPITFSVEVDTDGHIQQHNLVQIAEFLQLSRNNND